MKFSISDIDPQESPEEVRASIQRAISEKRAEFEVIHRTKSGQLGNVLVITQTIVLSGRTVLYTIWRDITDRKAAEKALLESEKESEQNLRLLFDSSTDAVFILDMQGNFIDFNRTAHERLGYTRDEMLPMKINELDPPEFASRVPARLAQIQEHGQAVFESAHVKKDGSKMPVEVNSRILDYKGMKVYFSVIRDITERKKAEEAKDRLLNAISASTEGIAITDDKDRFIYVNDAHARIFGCLPDELIGKTWRDTSSPELEALIERDLSKTLHNRAVGIWSGEFPGLRKDGTMLPTEVTAASRWNEAGNYLGHICIVRDVSERKRAEKALKESEERFKSLFESAPDAVFVADMESGLIVDANPVASRLLQLPHEKIIGLHQSQLHPPSTGEFSKEAFAEHVKKPVQGYRHSRLKLLSLVPREMKYLWSRWRRWSLYRGNII